MDKEQKTQETIFWVAVVAMIIASVLLVIFGMTTFRLKNDLANTETQLEKSYQPVFAKVVSVESDWQLKIELSDGTEAIAESFTKEIDAILKAAEYEVVGWKIMVIERGDKTEYIIFSMFGEGL